MVEVVCEVGGGVGMLDGDWLVGGGGGGGDGDGDGEGTIKSEGGHDRPVTGHSFG